MNAVYSKKNLLIVALLLAVMAMAAIAIPANNANAAPITMQNPLAREYTDINFKSQRNGSFENPIIGSSDQEYDTSAVPNWMTRGTGATNETKMHLFQNVDGINPADGRQFASISATTKSVLYQDVNLMAGKPYYVTFRHHAGGPNEDLMMFYFRQKGNTSQVGTPIKSTQVGGWKRHAYILTPSASNMEIAFENSYNGNAGQEQWRGNYVDDVQIITPSYLEAKLSVQAEGFDTAGKIPERNQEGNVTYLLEVKNTGESNAKNAIATLQLVDGIDFTSYNRVRNLTTNTYIDPNRSANSISFPVGDNGNLMAKGQTYTYSIECKVTGTTRGAGAQMPVGTDINNQVTLTYTDDVSIEYGGNAGPFTTYSQNDSTAAFRYQQRRGVQGVIFFDDNTENGYFNDGESVVKKTGRISLKDTNGDIVVSEDGKNCTLRVEDLTAGAFSFTGLPLGKYYLEMEEIPGYMTTPLTPDASSPTSNKAHANTTDKKTSVIDLDLSSGSGVVPYQNIGLVYSLHESITITHKKVGSTSNVFTVPPTQPITANVSEYLIDHGDTIKVDFSVEKRGPNIDIPFDIIVTLTQNCKVVSDGGGTVSYTASGQPQITWSLSNFHDAKKDYSFTFLAYERADASIRVRPRIRLSQEDIGNSAMLRIYPDKFNTEIRKSLVEKDGTTPYTAVRDEDFVYRIDYRAFDGFPIVYTYYAKVTVPTGAQSGRTSLVGLDPGHYTVTELETNWRYKIADSTNVNHWIQKAVMADPNASVTFNFWNKLEYKDWASGGDDEKNKMKPLQ